MRFIVAAAMALPFVFAVPAVAKEIVAVGEDADFLACDGVKAPQAGKYGTLLTDVPPTLGAAGLVACERAYAATVWSDKLFPRQVFVLRAAAAHALAANKPDDARALLDRADATIVSSPEIKLDTSLAVGNDLLRAIAYFKSGSAERGRAIVANIRQKRPYATSILHLALLVEASFDFDRDGLERSLRNLAVLNPDLIKFLLFNALLKGDYAAAERLGDQVRFDLPKRHGGWRMVDEETQNNRLIPERAEIAGVQAFVKLALGKKQESAAHLADARSDIAEAIAPPIVNPNGDKPGKRVLAAWEDRKRYAAKAAKILDGWETAMATRDAIAGKPLAEAIALIDGDALGRSYARADLLKQIRPADNGQRDAIAALLTITSTQQAEGIRRAFTIDLSTLLRRLPKWESNYIPKIQHEGGGFVRDDTNGYATKVDPDSGVVSLRFGNEYAPVASLEEAALITAARYLKQQGNPNFVLLSRTLISRVSRVTSIYSSYEHDSGFLITMGMSPIVLPGDGAMQWRVIRADDVIDRLGTKFPDPATKK